MQLASVAKLTRAPDGKQSMKLHLPRPGRLRPKCRVRLRKKEAAARREKNIAVADIVDKKQSEIEENCFA